MKEGVFKGTNIDLKAWYWLF